MSKLITKDLVIADDKSFLELFAAEDGLEKIKERLAAKAKELTEDQDLKTDKGRKSIASQAMLFVKFKGKAVELGKGSIEHHKAIVATATAGIKEIEQMCDGFRDEVKQPLIDYREAEKAFKEEIQAVKYSIENLALAFDYGTGNPHSVEVLNANLETLNSIEVTPEKFRDLTDEIADSLETAIKFVKLSITVETKRVEDAEELKRLQEAEAKRKQEEAAKAEAERLAEEQRLAEQQAKEAQVKRELKIKDDAIREQKEEAARKQRESEKALEEERSRAEKEKLEAQYEVQRLKDEKNKAIAEAEAKARALADQKAKEQAEREAKELEAKAEEERLLKDKAHKGRINKAAREDIMKIKGVDEELATKLVKAIVSGKIISVSISYT